MYKRQGGCYKQEIYKKYAAEKGEGIMRIAVTYENGQIFQHFGHTETFKIYDDLYIKCIYTTS